MNRAVKIPALVAAFCVGLAVSITGMIVKVAATVDDYEIVFDIGE